MKTFRALEFIPHPIGRGQQASMDFDNDFGVSVLLGDTFYSDGISTYEVAILKFGSVCYSTPITGDVLGYLNREEVSNTMIAVQELSQAVKDPEDPEDPED